MKEIRTANTKTSFLFIIRNVYKYICYYIGILALSLQTGTFMAFPEPIILFLPGMFKKVAMSVVGLSLKDFLKWGGSEMKCATLSKCEESNGKLLDLQSKNP